MSMLLWFTSQESFTVCTADGSKCPWKIPVTLYYEHTANWERTQVKNKPLVTSVLSSQNTSITQGITWTKVHF